MLNERNQIHNFTSSSGSGTVINYGSGSDFLTRYGSGSASQKVTVPTVPVPQHTACRAAPGCGRADVPAPPPGSASSPPSTRPGTSAPQRCSQSRGYPYRPDI